MPSQPAHSEIDPIENQLNRLLAIASVADRRRDVSSAVRPLGSSCLPARNFPVVMGPEVELATVGDAADDDESPPPSPSRPPVVSFVNLSGTDSGSSGEFESLSSGACAPQQLPPAALSLPHATPVDITVVLAPVTVEARPTVVDAQVVAISDGDVLMDKGRMIVAVSVAGVLLVGVTFAVSAMTFGLAGEGAPPGGGGRSPLRPPAAGPAGGKWEEPLPPWGAPSDLPTAEVRWGAPLPVGAPSDLPTATVAPMFDFSDIPTSSLAPLDPSDPTDPSDIHAPSRCVLTDLNKITAEYWHDQRGVVKDRAMYSNFGSSVSTAAAAGYVGAPGDDNGRGAAYTYSVADGGGAWTLEAKLVAPDGAAGDAFGSSVAACETVNGDVLVVGAVHRDAHRGAAYVFARDGGGGAPAPQQRLVAGDGVYADYFGFAVGISATSTVVVGAPGDGGRGIDTGAAYFFEHNSTAKRWEDAQKVVAEDGKASDYFGISVQIMGDVAVIGARGNPGQGSRGAAYIFSRVSGGGEWVQTHKLSGDGADFDSFGSSVSMSDDTIVVGAPNGKHGVVFVFSRGDAGEWIPIQKIVRVEGKYQNRFGNSLAVLGDILVIGAVGESYGNAHDVGATYLFSRDEGGEWLQTNKFVVGHEIGGTAFGRSVAAYNNTVVIGADEDDNTKGSVYVIGLEC